jgi:flagellar basal-body rod protein FlgB
LTIGTRNRVKPPRERWQTAPAQLVAVKFYLKLKFGEDDLFDMIDTSSQIDSLSRLLQQAELRQKVVSQNIANLNTPGYKSQDIRFESVLKQGTSEADVLASATIEETAGLVSGKDGNNVDLDRELGSLTKNAIEFQTFTSLLMSKLSLYRNAISG